MQVEAVRAELVVRGPVVVQEAALAAETGLGLGRPLGLPGDRWGALRPVVLRGHRADEARGAVAALRSTQIRHPLLHRV